MQQTCNELQHIILRPYPVMKEASHPFFILLATLNFRSPYVVLLANTVYGERISLQDYSSSCAAYNDELGKMFVLKPEEDALQCVSCFTCVHLAERIGITCKLFRGMHFLVH